MVEQDGLVGTASNASILEKAIAATTDYDTSLRVAEADGNSDIMALYEKLAIVVPAGAIMKNTVQQLGALLESGDGNPLYRLRHQWR